jgi:hypothetical protein
MASGWHPGDEATPVEGEVELMAVVLEGRHGNHAAEVADFFAILHRQHGDASRSKAWAGVASIVRRRTQERLLDN